MEIYNGKSRRSPAFRSMPYLFLWICYSAATVFMVLVGSGLQFFLSLLYFLYFLLDLLWFFWVKITVLNKVRDILEFFNQQICG
jgi:hypothetical protein